MTKRVLVAAIVSVLFSASWLCRPVAAGVDVNINISVPPPIAFPAPPPVVVIPGTYAYFAPDIDVDIIFFQGYWYRPYRGNWYRADRYDGRWVLLPPKRVPVVIMNLPSNWKHIPPGHEKIPYGQLKKNWRAWEREKHWDRHEKRREKHEEKREHGEERGRGRHNHG
jgi:hypothetical protein